jgi:hypothetical protein
MRTAIRIFVIAAGAAAPGLMPAQTLSGTVAAEDTGAPIGGATVLAIQKTASPAQRPVIYSAAADTQGRYAMSVSAGRYQLCVHGAGVYLNPCEWGAGSPTVMVATAAAANLRLQKGAWFIVRIHDTRRLLPQVETVRGSGVTVLLTGPAVSGFPLPLIYDNGRIRDYGAVVPMNSAMRARIASGGIALSDEKAAPLNAEGVPFQVTAADFQNATEVPRPLRWMFRPPRAKFLHVYTAERK